jgi:hypothetical protein
MEFASLREKLGAGEGVEIAALAVFGDKAEAALRSLEIAKEASEPIDAVGDIFNIDQIKEIKTYLLWMKHRLNDNESFTYIVDTAYKIARKDCFTHNTISICSADDLKQGDIYITVDGREYRMTDFEQA